MGKKTRGDADNTLPARFDDRHLLYQWAVQVPEFEVKFMDRVFKKMRGRKAHYMREDFCGTAALCAEWVRSGKKRRALGLDLDRDTLDWGQAHNIDPLGEAAERVELREADVRNVTEKVDVVCAYNFSWFLLNPFEELVGYLKKLRKSLEPDGLVFFDCYGGWEAQQVVEEPRLVETDEGMFTYSWEQASFDAINNLARCHIHFELAGGRRLKKAFTYEWRLYSPAEARDAFHAAGFSDVIVYWDHSDDPEVDIYRPAKKAENQPGWLAYIVGVV